MSTERFFVVESAIHGEGGRVATARIWVATEERARELAALKAGATWREVPLADVPLTARQARGLP